MSSIQRAIFLDRDGVLIEDRGLLTRTSEMILCENVFASLEILHRAKFKLFVVTNQPVIARGLISERGVQEIHENLSQRIVDELGFNPIQKFYFCPHHPNADIDTYKVDCTCRKPKPGMLIQAKEEHSIEMSQSYMVGDRLSDMMAGHLAQCRTVLIESGAHLEKPIQSTVVYTESNVPIQEKHKSLWHFARQLQLTT